MHLIFVIRKKLTPMLKIAEVVVVFSRNLTNNFTGRPGLFPMTPPNQIHHDFDTNEFICRHSEISDADQHPDIRRHGCDWNRKSLVNILMTSLGNIIRYICNNYPVVAIDSFGEFEGRLLHQLSLSIGRHQSLHGSMKGS